MTTFSFYVFQRKGSEFCQKQLKLFKIIPASITVKIQVMRGSLDTKELMDIGKCVRQKEKKQHRTKEGSDLRKYVLGLPKIMFQLHLKLYAACHVSEMTDTF